MTRAAPDFTTARPLERCHENNGWRTGVSGLASYTIPKIDVLVSGTFQNQPGAQLAANANCPAQRRPCTSTTLGRAFTGAPRAELQHRSGRRGVHRAAEPDRLPRREDVPRRHARARASTSTSTTSRTPTRCSRRTRPIGAAVENAAVNPAAAPVQAQRAVRFLKRSQGRSFRGPALTFAVTQDSKRKTQTTTSRVAHVRTNRGGAETRSAKPSESSASSRLRGASRHVKSRAVVV